MLELLRFSSTTELSNVSLSHPDSKYVKILWCSAMFNWNNVESGSSFEFDLGGNNISITAGQYDIDSLCTALESAIQTALSDGSATCSYDDDLNRVVITTTSTQAITNMGTAMGRLTGLENASTATTHTGPNPPNTSLGDVYVSIGNWNRGRISSQNTGFFCVIPKSAFNTVPVYDNLYNCRIFIGQQTHSNYNIKLTNEYGLSMDSIEASIMLGFE